MKRMSFRTSAEANDMELAATRARQRSDTPWLDSGAGTIQMSGSKQKLPQKCGFRTDKGGSSL